ncbi:MAG: hypothetical protein JWN34_2906 [Bryobacterales bacterium]|nr:hypothetical protein [Bryobacterales bacterium]
MFTLAEYTARDGMSDADRARYAQLTASLEADLRPDGALEICFAAAVLRGTWREQQYAAIETKPRSRTMRLRNTGARTPCSGEERPLGPR